MHKWSQNSKKTPRNPAGINGTNLKLKQMIVDILADI